jgi:diguanylate cyclase (GGDEF)-like protein
VSFALRFIIGICATVFVCTALHLFFSRPMLSASPALMYLSAAVAAVAAGVHLVRTRPERPSRDHAASHGDSFKNDVIEESDQSLESAGEADMTVLAPHYTRQAWEHTDAVIDTMVDRAIACVRRSVEAHTVAVFFPAPDGGFRLRRFLSHSEHIKPDAVIYPGKGVLGSFLKEGLKNLNLKDIVSDSITLHYYTRDAGIRSLIASPLLANNTEWGTIVADRADDTPFSKDDVEYLDHVAGLLALSVYYTHLCTDQQLRYAQLRTMSATEKYFFREHTVDAIIDKMQSIIPHVTQYDRLSISLRNEDEHEATIVRAEGPMADSFLDATFTLSARSVVGLVYSKNFALSRNFAAGRYETRYFDSEPKARDLRSFMIMPFGIDRCLGAILLESKMADAFSASSRSLLARMVTSAGIAIEKIKVIEQAQRLATHDGLTGLHNHRSFQRILRRELKRADRYKTELTLIICDIDHFKHINDTYGHQFGDDVLKGIADIFEKESRKDVDIPARYGGEEFALVLGNTSTDEAREITERIRAHIQAHVFRTTQSQQVSVTMSFGIASYRVHANRPNDLIKKADKALYTAKRNGRNRVEVF